MTKKPPPRIGYKPEFLRLDYELTKKFGYEKAALIDRLVEWQKHSRFAQWEVAEDGQRWFFHSRWYLAQELLLCETTISRLMKWAVEMKIVQIRQKSSMDRTNWLLVDLELVKKLREPEAEEEKPSESGESSESAKDEVEKTSMIPHGDSKSPCNVTQSHHAWLPKVTMAQSLYKEPKKEPTKEIPSAVQGTSGLAASPAPVSPEKKKRPSRAKPKPAVEVLDADEPSTSKGPGSYVWDAYEEAYEAHYRREEDGTPITPVRDARANKQCKRLVESYGVAEAMALVRHLLTSKDAAIVRNCHSILGLTDAKWTALRTEMLSGRRMTQSRAKEIDSDGKTEDLYLQQLEKNRLKYGGK